MLKKRQLKAELFLKLIQIKINNNRLSIVYISNIKKKLEIWFWYKSGNKTNLDIRKKRNNIIKSDLNLKKVKIK